MYTMIVRTIYTMFWTKYVPIVQKIDSISWFWIKYIHIICIIHRLFHVLACSIIIWKFRCNDVVRYVYFTFLTKYIYEIVDKCYQLVIFLVTFKIYQP